MKNDKGFTLVEILAAVVIMGILTGIAVPAVTHFIEKSRQESYNVMVSSLKDAAFNYAMNEGVDIPKYRIYWIDSDYLVEDKYLDALIDPADKSKTCSGFVGLGRNKSYYNGTDSIDDFKYCVYLKCSKYVENTDYDDLSGDCWSSRYAE